MVTLRMYDSNKSVADRYCRYVPTPRNKVREWGFMGMYLPFSFNESGIIGYSWGECKNGVKSANLGKKIKRETLPTHVQEWVNGLELKYNRALTEDTDDAWEEWCKA